MILFGSIIAGVLATSRPVALVHHAVSTTVDAAQERFDQGLTLVYSFNRHEARVRFEAAAAADPKLAMAWWGVALAVGPNINEKMNALDTAAAGAAIAKAEALETNASAEERRYIAALATRYPLDPKADTGNAASAYRDAMKRLVTDFPNDLDAATLYAESIMDVEDWSVTAGVPNEAQKKIVAVLDAVLARDPRHIGANHYLIHAWDFAGVADRALGSAWYLADLAYEPADSHLQHMPGHTFLDVGNFAEMLRTGRLATLDDDAYAKSAGVDPATLTYHGHNIDFWAGGALLRGETGQIEASTAEYERAHDPAVILMYLAQRRYADVDAVPKPARAFAIADWYYARCLAALARGDMGAASTALAGLDAVIRDDDKRKPTDEFHGALAHARMSHARGDDDTALSLLKHELSSDAGSAPETTQPWFFPAGAWIGDILFGRGDYAGAEAAYRNDLARIPNNPRVVYALMRTLMREDRLEAARALAPTIAAQWLGDPEDLSEPPI